MSTTVPNTWGQISFGQSFNTSSLLKANLQVDGSTTIRHGLNGAIVKDGMVGGGFNCGSGLYSFGQWGLENYSGAHQINIQNQFNLADWPCFSKFYITFPLNSLPSGVQINSATLTLKHFSNSGGATNPVNSLLQALTIAEDWDENTLTWNNAPLAMENVSQIWVESYYDTPPAARIWDLSSAVATAFASGQPLRLVIYSADSPQHSGKYFISSDAGAASANDRPTLIVNWSNP
ncbi:MAG: DNRLRE domain-containing protein [Anaerolineae bacterium]|nr:DNRLRE domain-containing protein [Anaerolineae bacterium]